MRHIKNLVSLGHDVSIVEIDVNKREQLSLDYDVYSSIEEAFKKEQFDIALICTPTKNHIIDALSISLKDEIKGIFCEKPLSYDLYGVETLSNICKENNIKLMTACNIRFNSGIKLISILLRNKTIGKPLSCQYYYGYDLKMWHPDSDYTKSYSSSDSGGILNDDIHAIDILMHLFGNPVDIKGILHKSGILQIENEDIASYVIKFDSGVIGSITSDYLSPFNIRNIQVIGEHGIIQWSFDEGYVNLKTKSINEWRTFNTQEDKNEMYFRQIEYFIDCVTNDITPLSDGIEQLKWALQLKRQNSI